tara:strand:- start:56 stop:514 length:459 start_codon:yes stop_codon:yes gene_type:complete
MAITVTSARPTAPKYRTSGRSVPTLINSTVRALDNLGSQPPSTFIRLQRQALERQPSIRTQQLPRGAPVSTARPNVPSTLDPNAGLTNPFSAQARENIRSVGERIGQAGVFQQGNNLGFVSGVRQFGADFRGEVEDFFGIPEQRQTNTTTTS